VCACAIPAVIRTQTHPVPSNSPLKVPGLVWEDDGQPALRCTLLIMQVVQGTHALGRQQLRVSDAVRARALVSQVRNGVVLGVCSAPRLPLLRSGACKRLRRWGILVHDRGQPAAVAAPTWRAVHGHAQACMSVHACTRTLPMPCCACAPSKHSVWALHILACTLTVRAACCLPAR